ncbi:MAG: glycerophosphodiester phosphodiesterase family protein [Syntrophales bacterium]|nr:glycerophosphodiester phosphodiesterase family protein [Syntrophales bacterium]
MTSHFRRPYHFFTYAGAGNAGFTIIAHRGASASHPENTLAAFEAAIGMGADMIELDVQLSRDGEVIVFHDETLSRCTDGRGWPASHTLSELKKLDAGSWFSEEFRGETIPTLEEAMSLCRGKIAVNIEIKSEAVTDDAGGGIEEKCLRIVDRSGMVRHVVFSSFDTRALRNLREIDGSAAVAVLYDKKTQAGMLPSEIVAMLGADSFNCSHRELGKKWLADLRKNGISLNVYTVNDEISMRRLLESGVEGIFTNRPDVLKKVIDDFRKTG